jgi:hypothetical protein
VKYLPLFHHFKAIYQFPKHIMFLVKIVANASLSNREWKLRWNGAPVQEDKKKNSSRQINLQNISMMVSLMLIFKIFIFLNFKVLCSVPEYDYFYHIM